jgi:hypothetical protein
VFDLQSTSHVRPLQHARPTDVRRVASVAAITTATSHTAASHAAAAVSAAASSACMATARRSTHRCCTTRSTSRGEAGGGDDRRRHRRLIRRGGLQTKLCHSAPGGPGRHHTQSRGRIGAGQCQCDSRRRRPHRGRYRHSARDELARRASCRPQCCECHARCHSRVDGPTSPAPDQVHCSPSQPPFCCPPSTSFVPPPV